MGEDLARAGLQGRHRIPPHLGPRALPRSPRLSHAGLTEPLERLGFNLVGYGCTTCIGNSGPLPDAISAAVGEADLAVVSVLSGNRNFEGRINPDVKMNYLASPPLCVAYALVGTMDTDIVGEPLGQDEHGNDVYLRDIWPSGQEVAQTISEAVRADVRRPPFLQDMPAQPQPVADVEGARVLALLGDSVTTDHISPAGSIKRDSPAGLYLQERGVAPRDFNSYGSRRGNHEVMMRGTFANIRLRNLIGGPEPLPEGGFTRYLGDGSREQMPIYDAAMRYVREGIELVVLAGREYGSGSSRDWAAKGTMLLGVRAVIAQSFERIHRSNLIGMGVLPLQFPDGESASSLGLTGVESFSISGLAESMADGGRPPTEVRVSARRDGADPVQFAALVRIDTPREAEYFRHGGILQYVLRALLA
jgi:aconitate hydratase